MINQTLAVRALADALAREDSAKLTAQADYALAAALVWFMVAAVAAVFAVALATLV